MDSNCDMFNSCKKTKFAMLLSAINNAEGFTTFQGNKSKVNSPFNVKFVFPKTGERLIRKFDSCDFNQNMTEDGFKVETQCECNSCLKACKYSVLDSQSPLNGFNYIHVIICYSFVIGLTIILTITKKYCNTEDKSNNEDLIRVFKELKIY